MISIITPVYNAGNYIARCVESLLTQTYNDIEYIFIDDASTDNSVEVLRQAIDLHPEKKSRVKILRNEKNSGCAFTRNRGIKAATGKYMIHVDGDDYVDSSFIEKLYNTAVAQDADVVVCDLYYDYGQTKKVKSTKPAKDTDEFISMVLSGEIHGSLCNKLIKSSIIKDHDIESPQGIVIGEDKFILLQVLHHARKVSFLPEALYFYNKTNEGAATTQTKESHAESYVNLTRHIVKLFADKNTSEQVINCIGFHKSLVLGHLLLYCKSIHLTGAKDLFKDVTMSQIFKHPIAPKYYKIACFLYKCKLVFLVSLMRTMMRWFMRK